MKPEVIIQPVSSEIGNLQKQWELQIERVSQAFGLEADQLLPFPDIPRSVDLRHWFPVLVIPPQEGVGIERILQVSGIHVSTPIEPKEDSELRVVLMALKGYEKLPNDGENVRDTNLVEFASLLIQRPDLIKPGQHIFLKEHFSEGDLRYYKDSGLYASLTPAVFSRYTPDDKTLRVMDL